MKLINLTESVCAHCFKKIDAEIVEDKGRIYMDKECYEHGKQRVLIWSDASTYRDWSKDSAYAPKYGFGNEKDRGCPYDCGYCTDHRGTTCTAVIEVTQRCNMNCQVCFASADASGDDLTFDKIKEMIGFVASTQGYCSLQLSGGEPTMRDDLPDIVRYAKVNGFKHVQVNTNGIRLSQDLDYVKALAEAGTDLVYLGFDGASDDIYQEIRGRKMMYVKKGCIENARIAGIGVMLVPVIVKGLNEDHVGRIVTFAKENMPVVKGIHYQPASQFGRYKLDDSNENRYTIPDLLNDLKKQTDGEICPCQILPRKKMSAYCSLSASYYLDFDNRLVALTKRGQDSPAEVAVTCCSDEDIKMHTFARKTNDFTEKFWTQNTCECNSNSDLGKFTNRIKRYSLAISAMPFQDAWNVDIGRVRSCCVSVINENLTAIPLCLNYLTNTKGQRLYRGGKCTI